MVEGKVDERERERRWDQLAKLYLSQQVFSYPPDYLTSEPTVDRLLETVERYEEDLTDETRVHGNLHAIIEVGEAIEVSEKRERTTSTDPLMRSIETELQSMLDALAIESRTWSTEKQNKPLTTHNVATSTV